MNQAAIHSAEALARFEAQHLIDSQKVDAEHSKVALRSGRNISNQPYGKMTEGEGDTSGVESNALVRIKTDANNDEDVDATYDDNSTCEMTVHPSPPSRAVLPWPASTISAPGMDAAGQIATLQAKLNQRLGPEYISTRQGPGGGKLSYLEGWKAIDLANEVFGFNGWSSSIMRMEIDFLDEMEGKKYNVGVSVVMRITLRDGTFHEDIGYGHCENVKMKHMALEKARKEASTDGLKRALRTFGKMLGNCLYDKKFVESASKVKAVATKYDMTELKRTSAAPQHASGSTAPVAQPATTAPAQRVVPPVQQRQQQPAAKHQQQPPQAPRNVIPAPVPAPDQSTTKAVIDSAPAQVDQQAPPAVLQTDSDRLREERRAMAAAKQAELRARKEKEELARQEASSGKTAKEALNLPLQVSIGEGQGQTAASSRCGRRISNEAGGTENADEYDLLLIGADLSDGADFAAEEVMSVKGSRPAVKPLSSSSMDDSGIGMVDSQQHHAKPNRTMQRTGSSAAAAPSKGRFVESSPTTRNDSGKIASSSPKPRIPVKGRRLSMVNGGTSSSNILRLSQEQQSPPSNSQRSRNGRQMNQPQAYNSRQTAHPPPKRSGPNQYNNVQVKRPRPSQI